MIAQFVKWLLKLRDEDLYENLIKQDAIPEMVYFYGEQSKCAVIFSKNIRLLVPTNLVYRILLNNYEVSTSEDKEGIVTIYTLIKNDSKRA